MEYGELSRWCARQSSMFRRGWAFLRLIGSLRRRRLGDEGILWAVSSRGEMLTFFLWPGTANKWFRLTIPSLPPAWSQWLSIVSVAHSSRRLVLTDECWQSQSPWPFQQPLQTSTPESLCNQTMISSYLNFIGGGENALLRMCRIDDNGLFCRLISDEVSIIIALPRPYKMSELSIRCIRQLSGTDLHRKLAYT